MIPRQHLGHPTTDITRPGLQEIGGGTHVIAEALTGSEYHFIIEPGTQRPYRVLLQQAVQRLPSATPSSSCAVGA